MEAETIYSSIARCGEVETGKENFCESGRSFDIQEQNQDPQSADCWRPSQYL
jgi:hypothetical protein